MNQAILPLIAMGLLSSRFVNNQDKQEYRSENHTPLNNLRLEPYEVPKEYILPDKPPYNTFVSNEYKISFKYPRTWVKNPRYPDKYEGLTGFFQVADVSNPIDNLDQVVEQEINQPYLPYGTAPRVLSLTVDGQPARLIYPSDDQATPLREREAALYIQYKTPDIINGEKYPYVVIWADKLHMRLIIDSFKFI